MAIRCKNTLPDQEDISAIASRLIREVRPIVADMLASIPSFLLCNVEDVLNGEQECFQPGPPAGGILLMYPIFILSIHQEILTESERAYLKGCLKWMARWHGLGQAEVLAGDPGTLERVSVPEAHTIIWAGMAS